MIKNLPYQIKHSLEINRLVKNREAAAQIASDALSDSASQENKWLKDDKILFGLFQMLA